MIFFEGLIALVFKFFKPGAKQIRRSAFLFILLNILDQVGVIIYAEPDKILFISLCLPTLFYLWACLSLSVRYLVLLLSSPRL